MSQTAPELHVPPAQQAWPGAPQAPPPSPPLLLLLAPLLLLLPPSRLPEELPLAPDELLEPPLPLLAVPLLLPLAPLLLPVVPSSPASEPEPWPPVLLEPPHATTQAIANPTTTRIDVFMAKLPCVDTPSPAHARPRRTGAPCCPFTKK